MLIPNINADYDFEPHSHAMESLDAAIHTCERIDRSLDHAEAVELAAEARRHLANVRGKAREYRNALVTEQTIHKILRRTYDSFAARALIPEKLGVMIADLLRDSLNDDPR